MAHQCPAPVVTFYHDIEQALDSDASPEMCREVVRAFLSIEARHHVRATYNVVGTLFVEQADLIDWIKSGGHDLGFHSNDHRRDWRASHSAAQIDACRAADGSILGYRSPRSELDDAGVRRLWEQGFLWSAESDRHDAPYFIHKGLVRLPIMNDDWPLHQGEVGADRYADDFAAALRERRYVAVGFHDTVTSFDPEARLRLWERLIELARQANATIVSFSEAADLFRRAIVADYYSRTAREWNAQTKILYRTTRLREIVSAEAARMGAPVIADLGSGGGVVSSAATGTAGDIYCVDNSPGMVADAQRAGMRAVLGEATDSGLEAHSVDLVLCARIVEYLFWPDRLANEIRRIGKPGGRCIVTFPARGKDPVSNEGSPPDRIRRYFTPDDIRAWAQPIGPGELFPLQYDPAEPADASQEREYRSLEANPPPDRIPTNWVFVGTIAGGEHLPRTPVIPLSAAPFRFDRGGADWLAPLKRIARRIKRRLG